MASSYFIACKPHKGKTTVAPLESSISRFRVDGSGWSCSQRQSRVDDVRNCRWGTFGGVSPDVDPDVDPELDMATSHREVVLTASEVARARDPPATRFDEALQRPYR